MKFLSFFQGNYGISFLSNESYEASFVNKSNGFAPS